MKKIIQTMKKIRFPKAFSRINIVEMFGLYRFKTSAIVVTMLALFLGTNMLISLVSLRLDMSKGKAYTLSPSTKKIISSLDKTMALKLYSSKNIPARLQPLKREAIDILREYERQSGNVTLSIIEFTPAEDAGILKEAQDLGITPVPVREQDRSEVSLTEIYFGLGVQYKDKQTVLPQALDVENLEYNISSSLYQLTRETLPTVAVMGVPDVSFNPQADELGVFKQLMGQLFDIKVLSQPSIGGENEDDDGEPFQIDADTDALLVIDSPQTTFSKEELEEIEKFAAKKNVIVMLNGVSIDANLTTSDGEKDLLSFLKKYGVTVEPNLILSARSEFVNMGGNGVSLLIPYPLWIWASDFSTDSSAFTNVGRLTFPWASEVRGKDTNGYVAQEVVRSARESWAQKGNLVLDPQKLEQPTQDMLKVFPLAVESTKKGAGRIMVIGSSRFILNNYISPESQNMEFMLNVLSDYASDGELAGIGSRAVNLYPLPELSENLKELYKYANILILPGMFALYGVWRLWKRSHA